LKRHGALVTASIVLSGVQASYAGRLAEEAVQPIARCGPFAGVDAGDLLVLPSANMITIVQ
jgi:hypothetical protein